MAEFVIYTTEGFTQDPNGNDIENCQMLGEACGNNLDEAKDNLLKENPWIAKAGFNRSKFIVRQLLTNKEHAAIKEVLEYLWENEGRHFEKQGEPSNHIFPILKQLNDLIN
ncbi:MAG: hypothetical protein E7070_01925 [Bacteroidales bacterium]|jgi:hypothetical protein|nr:hypothetical protein [Bacteroidales bacterium]